ncbi:MAG: glycosyltransferase [Oscillospiraceae bacterium]|nr:glycosyltransferase [Oscillospiraceae bacterium]
MKITFFSNFLNHHQLPLCHAFCAMPQVEFTFVATQAFNSGVVSAGYTDMNTAYDFCLPAYLNEENAHRAQSLAQESDFVIIGSAPMSIVKRRIAQNKPVLRYSERLFKPLEMNPDTLKTKLYLWLHYTRFKNKRVYYLCASAYLAGELKGLGISEKKMFRWGYFPQVITDQKTLNCIKKNPAPQLLWAGRMINWKHAELAIEAAAQLKAEGYTFLLIMIGDGVCKNELAALAAQKGVQDCVAFTGALQAADVTAKMQQADVFIATSDYNEGWGAVVNESMASGCAVVASHAMGSVPYLIQHGQNGLVFESGNLPQLTYRLRQLLEDKALCAALGKSAQQTIKEQWNAHTAAQNLVQLLQNNMQPTVQSGPAAYAPAIAQEDMAAFTILPAQETENDE